MNIKRAISLVILLLALVSTKANAWFFFFLPGSLTSKIGDALTGAEGESCVGEKAKVGDILRSASGNTATIKSLSGTSGRCTNPLLPIRALLEFSYSFTSKAGINLPDGYEPQPLTDMQKYQGVLMIATYPAKKMGVNVGARKREADSDPAGIARGVGTAVTNALVDAKASNEEQLKVSGMMAWRFEVTGKTKGIFGQKYTYLITVLEGDQEFVVINAWSPTDDYEHEKEAMKQLAANISGIHAPTSPVVASPPPAPVGASAPPAPVVPTPPTVPVVASPLSAPAVATPAPISLTSQEEKLRELKRLNDAGLISQEVFFERQRKILE